MKIENGYGKIVDELHKIIDGDFDTAWINVEMSKDSGSVGVYFKTKEVWKRVVLTLEIRRRQIQWKSLN